MKVDETQAGSITVLVPGDRLDNITSESLEKVLEQTIQGGKNQIVVDLEQVPFMSSQGLRVILTGVKVAQAAGGRMVVCSSPEAVTKIFDITGVRRLMGIYPSREEALKSFEDAAGAAGRS